MPSKPARAAKRNPAEGPSPPDDEEGWTYFEIKGQLYAMKPRTEVEMREHKVSVPRQDKR